VPGSKLEVADIFRRHGEAWRAANDGHFSLTQRRVMTAIEICRTAALGGHVERCDDCGHSRIAYNSCRNRHCPKCQCSAAERWLAAREAELLPVPYYHVVFTLPAAIGAIAYQNKAKVYGLLFSAAAEALTTIAADPKHLGAQIGLTAVLHTWGQNLDHHPHVHCIVPGGGLPPHSARPMRRINSRLVNDTSAWLGRP
jgi:Transposase zinc-binding domain/Putative transposase